MTMHKLSNEGSLRTHIADAARRAAAVTGASALLFSLAAAGQEIALVENAEELTATVTAVHPESRLIELETEDGREVTVEASEEVRNFDQIASGDQVEVMFYEALAAALTEAPATEEEEPVILETARAPLGDKPAGATSLVYTAVVTIDDVDADSNTVSFTGPRGLQRTVAVEQPEMQDFIKDLQAGDRVRITYGEALAVAVRPAE